MPGNILIVDGISTNRIVLRVKLSSAFFSVIQAATGAEAMALIAQHQPDLIMVSARLPDMSGEAFCKQVKISEQGRDCPVVLIQPQSDRTTLISGLSAGADEVLFHPFSDALLFARLRSLIRGRSSFDDLGIKSPPSPTYGMSEPATPFLPALQIGLVAPQPTQILMWKKVLQRHPRHRLTSHQPRSLMGDLTTDGVPDILIVHLGGRVADNGLALLAGLRAQPELRRTQFLAVLDEKAEYLAADALDLGANDLLLKDFGIEEATLRLTKLARNKHLADRLHFSVRDGLRAAVTDPLTGLHNRRFALPELAKMLNAGRRHQSPVAVMMVDIDHFKRVNDTFGHAIGDAVLRQVAARMTDMMRPQDLLARIGGEEFLIALPGLKLEQARYAAKRLCDAVGTAPIQLKETQKLIYTTISIGLAVSASRCVDDVGASDLLDLADQALYSSKAEGRNQVSYTLPAA